MRTGQQENAEAKENQHLDSGVPDQSQSIRHQPTYFRPEPSLSLRPDPPACNQRGKQSCFLILLGSGKGWGLWLWHPLFSYLFFFFFFFFFFLLLTVIGLTTMQVVCRITFMLYPIFIYRIMILRNWLLNNFKHIFFWIYILKRVREKSRECHNHKPHPLKSPLNSGSDRSCCRRDLSSTLNFKTKSKWRFLLLKPFE